MYNYWARTPNVFCTKTEIISYCFVNVPNDKTLSLLNFNIYIISVCIQTLYCSTTKNNFLILCCFICIILCIYIHFLKAFSCKVPETLDLLKIHIYSVYIMAYIQTIIFSTIVLVSFSTTLGCFAIYNNVNHYLKLRVGVILVKLSWLYFVMISI